MPQSTVNTLDADTTNKTLITKEWFNSKIASNNLNYIPISQKSTANGVATLDSAVQIPNAQIPNRLIDKIIAIGGEGIDRSFTGLYDRNQLALADKEHTVTTVLSGSGGITGGIDSFNSTIFNSKPDFAVLTGCDNTTELVITINLNSTLQNYSRGLWQPFVQTRLGNAQYFRNIAVEVMDGNNVWYTPANLIANNISTISNSGLYLFSETSVGTAAIRGVRFKLSNPLTSNGVVYLSNIGLRHISHTFAPQFPHRGDNNTFYGNNTFTQSPVIPNGTLVTHAVNLNQLNNAIGSHTHTFSSITSKPTTLSGYGITDAIPTSHPVNGVNTAQINNWNSAFGWGNHAAAGYATSDFVDESIAQITAEFINPDYPISASGRINNVIITEEFTKEYLELEAELIPERQITVTNLAPFDIDVKREDHSIDTIRARETTEYYITAERRLIKKGSYHSAAFLN